MPTPKEPIRPEESLAKMIANLATTTGKTLEEWQAIVAERNWIKHGEIVAGLKSEFGLSHGYANQIALRSGAKQTEATEDPLVVLWQKRPEVKPLYDHLVAALQKFGPDVDLGPKKAYVSVRRKKQFAILQPAANRLDVGIQLKDVTPEGRLEASGSFNAMVTHRVRISSLDQIDADLLGWLKQAYEQAS